jgi:non-homologous end joining protein Ku
LNYRKKKEDRSNVVDLMETLRRSVTGKGRKEAALRASTGSKKTSRVARPQRRKRKSA